jgi:hypothetical protein
MSNTNNATQNGHSDKKSNARRKPTRIRLSSDDGIEYLLTREKANKFLDDLILWKCDMTDNDPTSVDYVPPPKLTDPCYAAEPPQRQGIYNASSTDKVKTLLTLKEIIISGKDNDTIQD